jgi:hypothetical protein
MRHAVAIAAITLVVWALVSGDGVAANDPFAKTSWLTVLRHDPAIREDHDMGTPGHAFFTADHIGGYYARAHATVIGRAGGEWIAAVPLDTGGSIGLSGYLLYHPHVAKHFAEVGGSENLHFDHDMLVTLDATADRTSHRGIERTFSVHGDRVMIATTRRVTLPQ